MKNRSYLLSSIICICFLADSCVSLRSCDSDLSGRYYCNNDNNAVNYLDINKDGTYLHFFKKESIELTSKGTWKKVDDSYCKIELEDWRDYNVNGENYEDYILALLFINGGYLDISPDGDSSNSFKKRE